MKGLRSKIAVILLSFFYCLTPILGMASQSINLSIEPSVFLINLKQGDSWASSIKINNNNESNLPYSVSLMDFEKDKKDNFVPVLKPADSYPPSSWIKISQTEIDIKKGESGAIQFRVEIPADAKLGDHRALILVGLSPKSTKTSGTSVAVSSLISSVLSINVSGSIGDKLIIKDFSASRLVYENPDVALKLELENKGNVRIEPEGTIEIKNLFGKNIGSVFLSKKIMAGLKFGTKKSSYILNWSPSDVIFGLGPYMATVNLSYGGDIKNNITARSIFWIFPYGIFLKITATILGLLIMVDLFMRIYLRRLIKKKEF